MKTDTGLDVINYPQLMDIYTQFLKPIRDYEVDSEPNLIINEKAQVIETHIIKNWAKSLYETKQLEEPIKLKVCVTGPLELYFKVVGFEVYQDMAMNFARSVNSFLKNSMIDTPFLKTTAVSIDEPSLGYVTITNTSDDDMIEIYDESVKDINADIQIHLHSLNSFKIPLQTENINIMTCEFASNPQNVIDKKYLDQYDKYMRVGVCSTNINAIMANKIDSGQSYSDLSTVDGLLTLIDSEDQIKHNFKLASKQYGERLKYVGPDCGLSSWAPPKVAQELLTRTCKVVKNEMKK